MEPVPPDAFDLSFASILVSSVIPSVVCSPVVCSSIFCKIVSAVSCCPRRPKACALSNSSLPAVVVVTW